MVLFDPRDFHAPRSSYTQQDLLRSGQGGYFGPGNAQLPAPPMLMMDRITEISADGGEFGKGHVIAELDITPELWFFSLPLSRRSSHAGMSRSGRHVADHRLLAWLVRLIGQGPRRRRWRGEISRRHLSLTPSACDTRSACARYGAANWLLELRAAVYLPMTHAYMSPGI